MVHKGWKDLCSRFEELGGIAQNICQSKGEFGRGIFPIDPSSRAKIMTPKNLLIKSDNVGIREGKIVIKDGSLFSADEKIFLEMYYNEFSWGDNGRSDSANFLKFIARLPDSLKRSLLDYGFVSTGLLNAGNDEKTLFKRFIDERTVGFAGDRVLAPVWEFVNHSSFSPPLRVTPFGVETPPLDFGSGEILHKYSETNSPIGMWKNYGFACRCVVAYSIPFAINLNNGSRRLKCSGRQGFKSNVNNSFTLVNDSIVIESLPIGCLSNKLPISTFTSIMCSAGLSLELGQHLFLKVREMNLKARYDLLNRLQGPDLSTQAELSKALTYEIELIQRASTGHVIEG
ncbi:hypothetical protein N9U07_00540 [bacterium]|nr:hypothetical protein [bacterium]